MLLLQLAMERRQDPTSGGALEREKAELAARLRPRRVGGVHRAGAQGDAREPERGASLAMNQRGHPRPRFRGRGVANL